MVDFDVDAEVDVDVEVLIACGVGFLSADTGADFFVTTGCETVVETMVEERLRAAGVGVKLFDGTLGGEGSLGLVELIMRTVVVEGLAGANDGEAAAEVGAD